MSKNKYVIDHDYGYGLNVNPKKINKLYLRTINDLKLYVKDIIYKNIIENKNLKLKDITNSISIEKIDYHVDYLG